MIEGRQYNTLARELEGLRPLSAHVKIDVEGSEWTVLHMRNLLGWLRLGWLEIT